MAVNDDWSTNLTLYGRSFSDFPVVSSENPDLTGSTDALILSTNNYIGPFQWMLSGLSANDNDERDPAAAPERRIMASMACSPITVTASSGSVRAIPSPR